MNDKQSRKVNVFKVIDSIDLSNLGPGVSAATCRDVLNLVARLEKSGDGCFASINWLAFKLDRSRSCVQRSIAALERAGLLDVTARFRASDGLQLTNVLQVVVGAVRSLVARVLSPRKRRRSVVHRLANWGVHLTTPITETYISKVVLSSKQQETLSASDRERYWMAQMGLEK